jgi:hypothetical protein
LHFREFPFFSRCNLCLRTLYERDCQSGPIMLTIPSFGSPMTPSSVFADPVIGCLLFDSFELSVEGQTSRLRCDRLHVFAAAVQTCSCRVSVMTIVDLSSSVSAQMYVLRLVVSVDLWL